MEDKLDLKGLAKKVIESIPDEVSEAFNFGDEKETTILESNEKCKETAATTDVDLEVLIRSKMATLLKRDSTNAADIRTYTEVLYILGKMRGKKK